MVEKDRHDRHRAFLDDLLEASMEGEEKTGPRYAPFGEDADDVPLGERLAGGAQTLRSGPAIDRNHPAPAEDIAQHRHVQEPRPDHESHRPRHGGDDH